MAVCRAACSRGTTRAPWSKLDKVLLAFTITGFALSSIFAVTVFRMAVKHNSYYAFEMQNRHHNRHHGHHGGPQSAPFTEETDCHVQQFEPEESEIECIRNERGEWCAAERTPAPARHVQRRDAHSDEEERHGSRSHEGRSEHHGGPHRMGPGHHGRDSHEEGMHPPPHHGNREEGPSHEPELPASGVRQRPGHDGRRRFPCMRMRVRWQHRERMMDAMAHQNVSEATNFPQCSFSSCEEDPDVNRRRMEEMRRLWEGQRNQPTRCLVNRENPGHVIILRQRLDRKAFVKSCGFQLTFLSFGLGMLFLVALIVRRCRSKKTEAKKVNPVKLPGGAYVVTTATTDGMSEKEKEAFGISSPAVSNGPVPAAPKEFLVLAPPAYDSKPADMQVQPPAYDAAPEKQV